MHEPLKHTRQHHKQHDCGYGPPQIRHHLLPPIFRLNLEPVLVNPVISPLALMMLALG